MENGSASLPRIGCQKGSRDLTFFKKLFVPYVAHWSFRERFPVVERPEEISNPTSISAAYARIAGFFVHDFAWSALEAGAQEAERQQDKARIAKLEQQEAPAES